MFERRPAATAETKERTEEEYLLEQFNRPEKIAFGAETIEVVDIAPHILKTDVPTFVIPGFSATPEALKDLILQTALTGRRVISAYAPHGIDITEKRADIADAQLRKLELVLGVLEAKNLSKVSVIANSEACIYAATAGVLAPDRFSNMVLIEPAGLIGEDTTAELLTRVLADMQSEPKINKEFDKVAHPAPMTIGLKSVLSNIPASIREIRGISQADITGSLKSMHDAGIGLSIIHAVDDQYFPMERVQKMTKANMLDGFYSVKGSHNSVYTYEPFGKAAEAALEALEQKQKMKIAAHEVE